MKPFNKVVIIISKNKLKLFFGFAFVYAVYMISSYIGSNDFIDDLHDKNYKVIQLFTERFYDPNWGNSNDKLGYEAFESCEGENRCFAFKSILKPYEKSDAVVAHIPNLIYMPSKKKVQT